MFCKYCGSEIADDSVFCPSCGKDVAVSILNKKTDNIESKKEDKPIPAEGRVSLEKAPDEDSFKNKGLHAEINSTLEASTWYYQDGSELGGPLTYDMLKSRILSGSIDRDAKVKQDVNDPWIALSESPFWDAAPKQESGSVYISDKWIWCFSIIPMLVNIAFTYFHLEQYIVSTANWIAVVGLNILFFLLDKKELEKKGFTPEAWMWLGIFIVPVYLIVREVKTNRNFVPAIIWCFLEVVAIYIL